LHLERWPFRTVPDPTYATFIADRKQLREDLEALITGLQRRDASSIHLFWAWFGAGKTHSLYYLANRLAALDESMVAAQAVYSEFPKAPSGFVDVYRAFATGLRLSAVGEAFLEVSTSPAGAQLLDELMLASPDLYTALHVVATGEPRDRAVAVRWLRGERLPVSQYRKVGLSRAPTTSEEATTVLSGLIKLLSAAAASQGYTGSVTVWLLDEFQRIADAPPRVRRDINAGLHSTFNSSPSGLTLMLSFSGEPAEKLPDWFSPELRDRIGRTRVLVLPPMLPAEGADFIADVLRAARGQYSIPPSPYFPFTEDGCDAILKDITKRGGELKPRAIMQACDAVLSEAASRLETGDLDAIGGDVATEILREYTGFDLDDAEAS
jgi:hypothetical protein